jgi:hypothetical protein
MSKEIGVYGSENYLNWTLCCGSGRELPNLSRKWQLAG